MVSVIIPNYNHAPYLQRRIESVLHQTYQDFELILLDDCSTDNSAAILQSYQDYPQVSHVVVNDKNSGSTFKQWEKGFELSKGDLIWIAESDDWCEATLLENLVPPFEEDSIVLSFCQSLLIDESGEIIYQTKAKQLEERVNGDEFVKSRMFGDTVLVNAGMAVFRKSVIAQVNEQYKMMKGAGDWMFWVQIALAGKVFVSGKGLNFCFRHQGTVTSKAEISGQDIEEGNIVFKYVFDNTHPTKVEIEKALLTRINIYFNQRKRYDSIQTQKKALNRILGLYPNAKSIYRKLYMNKLLYSLVYKFNTLFS